MDLEKYEPGSSEVNVLSIVKPSNEVKLDPEKTSVVQGMRVNQR